MVTSGASSSAGGVSSTDVKFHYCSDLLPDPLTKQATPLECIAWLNKFEFWIGASFGSIQPESTYMAKELCVKLDADWTAVLKSTLNDRKIGTNTEIVEAIKTELLVQHPVLTCQVTLFSMETEKGQNLRD